MVLLPSQDDSSIASVADRVGEFHFTSTLSCRHENALEALMFFNPQQKKFRNTVSQLVECYGNPKIFKDGDRIRLQIGSSSIAQTLFCLDRATDGELIGVVVYIRESIEQLAIIHLAVQEDYLMSGCYGDRALALRLIQKVQEIGARLKGVESIKILYERSLKKFPFVTLQSGNL
ncbi:hypothetical protein HC931_04340 [Candidatus Gracilibacteria bacterium]|nr:hypothetical protein [Candidatus Gracilibacteria bacterium]NJM88360.1 hypothetical protein [Hydrococcus sp. RU_2_2]NJP21444.1 hypothetical protein [Hydrococcus sp. CRU_1_1]